MKFHRRSYDVWVMSTFETPPWDRRCWAKLVPIVEPLLDVPKTSVRTSQYVGPAGKKRLARFGKLGWNAASHARWTSPAARGASFLSMELWCPGWSTCARRDLAPEVFLSMLLPSAAGAPTSEARLLFAVAVDSPNAPSAKQAGAELAIALQAEQRVTKRRAWGTSSGAGFVDSLQDFLMTTAECRGLGSLRGWKAY